MGWKDLIKAEDVELVLIRTYSPFQLEAKIAIFMDDAHQYESRLEIGAIIDCYFNLYMFANEHKLPDDKLLLLLKLQTKLLENCEGDIAIYDSLKYFCDTLKEDEMDETLDFGNLTTSKDIIDHMLQSFFQHYELYHYMFHHSQTEEELTREISLDVIPVAQPYPPPLEEGMAEDWYNLYLNPKGEVHEENVNESEEVVPLADTLVHVEEDLNEADVEHKVESLLATINEDDMKKLIKETAEKKLTAVKVELESKIMEKEAMLLKNLDKLKVS